jgi:hypothetical protein
MALLQCMRLQQRQEAVSDKELCGEAEPKDGIPFPVPGLFIQSLVGIIESVWTLHPTSKLFHMHGYCLRHSASKSTSPATSSTPGPLDQDAMASDKDLMSGKVYTSPHFLLLEEELLRPHINCSHPEHLCLLLWVIVALMFWSDATQLAQFGNVKVWLIYVYFGNLSKYFYLRPSSNAGVIVIYIPPVSRSLHPWVTKCR